MTLIKWKKEYDTNLKEVNHQHLEMMNIMNELNVKYINGYNSKDLVDIMNKLSNYCLTHFSTEEKYFEKHNFPNSDEHIMEHQYFLRKIEFYKDDLQNGHNDFFKDMLKFLTAWLNDHILNTDKKYVDYFKEMKINLIEDQNEFELD